MLERTNTILVMWEDEALGVATAALRAAGLEYFAFETPVKVDELNDAITETCKAIWVDKYFADEEWWDGL
jgi:hypothetical protein